MYRFRFTRELVVFVARPLIGTKPVEAMCEFALAT